MTININELFSLLHQPTDPNRRSGLRIFAHPRPGNNPFALCRKFHDHLRALGYDGEIQFIYSTDNYYMPPEYGGPEPIFTTQKVASIFNVDLDETTIIKHPDCNTFFISIPYYNTYSTDDMFRQMHIGICDHEAGGFIRKGADTADFLKVDYLALIYSHPQPGTEITIAKHGALSENISLSTNNYQIASPLPTLKNTIRAAESKKMITDKPGVLSILKGMQDKRFLIHTIYGLNDIFKFSTSDIIQRLVNVHQHLKTHSNDQRPVLILLMDEYAKFNPASLKNTATEALFDVWNASQSLDTQIENLPDNAIVVAHIGRVEMRIFEYLYTSSQFAPTSEGDGTEILNLRTNLAKLPTRALKKETQANSVILDSESLKLVDVQKEIQHITTALCAPLDAQQETTRIEIIADYLLGVNQVGNRFNAFWTLHANHYQQQFETDCLSFVLLHIYKNLTTKPLPALYNPDIDKKIKNLIATANKDQIIAQLPALLVQSNVFVVLPRVVFSTAADTYMSFIKAYRRCNSPARNKYAAALMLMGDAYPEGATLVERYQHEITISVFGEQRTLPSSKPEVEMPILISEYRDNEYINQFIAGLIKLRDITNNKLHKLTDTEKRSLSLIAGMSDDQAALKQLRKLGVDFSPLMIEAMNRGQKSLITSFMPHIDDATYRNIFLNAEQLLPTAEKLRPTALLVPWFRNESGFKMDKMQIQRAEEALSDKNYQCPNSRTAVLQAIGIFTNKSMLPVAKALLLAATLAKENDTTNQNQTIPMTSNGPQLTSPNNAVILLMVSMAIGLIGIACWLLSRCIAAEVNQEKIKNACNSG